MPLALSSHRPGVESCPAGSIRLISFSTWPRYDRIDTAAFTRQSFADCVNRCRCVLSIQQHLHIQHLSLADAGAGCNTDGEHHALHTCAYIPLWRQSSGQHFHYVNVSAPCQCVSALWYVPERYFCLMCWDRCDLCVYVRCCLLDGALADSAQPAIPFDFNRVAAYGLNRNCSLPVRCCDKVLGFCLLNVCLTKVLHSESPVASCCRFVQL